MKKRVLFSVIVIMATAITSCRSSRSEAEAVAVRKYQIIETNIGGHGHTLEIEFSKGKEHNHPLMAIWLEDTMGNYIQTLYIVRSIATSTFNYGEVSQGKWLPGIIRRPASLPYWAHKRDIQEEDGLYVPSAENPVPDAYTAATPKADFILKTKSDKPLPEIVYVMFEINQSWDWNEYWTNNKFPDDPEYRTSSQPALVYSARVNTNKKGTYLLHAIGHSHYSGKTGDLFTDLSTITTALNIAESIKVSIR